MVLKVEVTVMLCLRFLYSVSVSSSKVATAVAQPTVFVTREVVTPFGPTSVPKCPSASFNQLRASSMQVRTFAEPWGANRITVTVSGELR